MLLPLMAVVNAIVFKISYNFLVVDVNPLCYMSYHLALSALGRWYCLYSFTLVDVITNVW